MSMPDPHAAAEPAATEPTPPTPPTPLYLPAANDGPAVPTPVDVSLPPGISAPNVVTGPCEPATEVPTTTAGAPHELLSIDPATELVHVMTAQEYEHLKEDIRRHGVLCPIVVGADRRVLDGRHRLRAYCELLAEGAEVPEIPITLQSGELTDAEKYDRVIAHNVRRRHLKRIDVDRLIAEQLTRTPDVSDRSIRQNLGAVASRAKIAAVRKSLEADGTIAAPDKRTGADGKARCLPRRIRTIHVAGPQQLEKVLDVLPSLPDSSIPAVATTEEILWKARKVRQQERVAERRKKMQQPPPLPTGKQFPVVLADPPWQYSAGKSSMRSTPESYYPTMPLDEICALKIRELAADDAVLYLWATAPMLYDAMKVIDAWGFKYLTSTVWVKTGPKTGMGFWVESQHEYLLIARRGDVPPPPYSTRLPIIEAPRTVHSAKPPEVRELITKQFPDVRRIELFAREAVEGWEWWGNHLPGATDHVA